MRLIDTVLTLSVETDDFICSEQRQKTRSVVNERRYASAAYVVVSCPTVHRSVSHKPALYQNG